MPYNPHNSNNSNNSNNSKDRNLLKMAESILDSMEYDMELSKKEFEKILNNYLDLFSSNIIDKKTLDDNCKRCTKAISQINTHMDTADVLRQFIFEIKDKGGIDEQLPPYDF